MYEIVVARAFTAEKLEDNLTAMVNWANNFVGTEVAVQGYPVGVAKTLRSLSHSLFQNRVIATLIVGVEETGPIVEELPDASGLS